MRHGGRNENSSDPNGTKISATGGKFYGKAGVGDTLKTLIFIDHPGSQP
jgi:hypothetical protein